MFKWYENDTNATIWVDEPLTVYFSRNNASNNRQFWHHNDLYVENRFSFMVEARFDFTKRFIISYKGSPVQPSAPWSCTAACGNPRPRVGPPANTLSYTIELKNTCFTPTLERTINFNGSTPCPTSNVSDYTFLLTISIPFEPIAPKNGDVFVFEVTATPPGSRIEETVPIRAIFVDTQCTTSISLMPPSGPQGTVGRISFNATNAKRLVLRDQTSRTNLYDEFVPANSRSIANLTRNFSITANPGSQQLFTVTAYNLMNQPCTAFATFSVPQVPRVDCSNCAKVTCRDCPNCCPEPPPIVCPDGYQLFCVEKIVATNGINGLPLKEAFKICATDWDNLLDIVLGPSITRTPGVIVRPVDCGTIP